MKVYEALAELFYRENTTRCFALLGDANMNWAAALEARGTRFVYVRDEHNAVAAAMSWARTTGRTGLATVTCGPGLTQILTALPAAARARIPMIVFSGEAPLRKAWYNQGIEQKPFVEACGAHYVSLVQDEDSGQSVWASRLVDAFQLAKTKSCPVVVGVPLDVQEDEWTGGDLSVDTTSNVAPTPVAKILPSTTELESAAELVVSAKRIVVLAGLGAIKAQAAESCHALAVATGSLLATTLPARGMFWQDPFYLGVAGGFASDTARKYLQQADLIIAVGTRLSSHTSDGGKLWPAEQVLHIDVEPRSTSQGLDASKHHVRSDALEGVLQLLQAIQAHPQYSELAPQAGWRSDAIAEEIASTPADGKSFNLEPGLLDPRAVVKALDEALPTDWYTVNSSGHCSWFAAQMYRRPADRFFTLREFGAIGNGLAFALGVAVAGTEADKKRPVVLFDGDGSFLMHIQELETIVRHGLKVLVCIFNDGAYGSEIHKLRAHGLSDNGGVFGRPDFAAIARGFGLQGHQVTGLTDLGLLMQEFEKSDSAAVWDFHVSDQVVSPLIRRSYKIE